MIHTEDEETEGIDKRESYFDLSYYYQAVMKEIKHSYPLIGSYEP